MTQTSNPLALLDRSNVAACEDAVLAYVALKLNERDMDWTAVYEASVRIRETIGLEWIVRLDRAGEAKGWDLLASLSRKTLLEIAKGETLGQMVGLL